MYVRFYIIVYNFLYVIKYKKMELKFSITKKVTRSYKKIIEFYI